jgi:hypothetical protein
LHASKDQTIYTDKLFNLENMPKILRNHKNSCWKEQSFIEIYSYQEGIGKNHKKSSLMEDIR